MTAMAENANEIDLMWNSTNSGVGSVVTDVYIYRSTTSPFTPSSQQPDWHHQEQLVPGCALYSVNSVLLPGSG